MNAAKKKTTKKKKPTSPRKPSDREVNNFEAQEEAKGHRVAGAKAEPGPPVLKRVEKKNRRQVGVRMKPDVYDAFVAICEEQEISASRAIEQIVEQYVEAFGNQKR